MPLPKKMAALLAAFALATAACGSSNDVATATDSDDAAEVDNDAAAATGDDDGAAETTAEAVPDDSGIDAINGGKPVVEIPGGDAPQSLLTEDLISGNGDTAESGDLLVMHYVGVLHEDGSEFDSSWDRGDTFNFVLGQGRVIQGWDEGIVGMAEGSRRQLTIPAAQAYGEQGAGADIPPGAALIFVVDLVNAHSPHEIDVTTDDPDSLEVTEIVAGDGAELAEGDVVEVTYSLALESTGEVVRSSWTDGSTAEFAIGVEPAQVFIGWSESLVGRNIGDELRIVVPPALGPDPESGDTLITQLTVVGVVG